MEAKKRKKLSKAEEKRLVICRERALDLFLRMEEMVQILRKKEWNDARKLREVHYHVNEIFNLLSYMVLKQNVLKKEVEMKEKTIKCINCNNDVEIDIAKAIDEEGEVFHCPCCGFIFSYTDK